MGVITALFELFENITSINDCELKLLTSYRLKLVKARTLTVAYLLTDEPNRRLHTHKVL